MLDPFADLGTPETSSIIEIPQDFGFKDTAPEPPKPDYLDLEQSLQTEKDQIKKAQMDRLAAAKQEEDFQGWYSQIAKQNKLDPNPDDPQHFYDYRSYFKSIQNGQSQPPQYRPEHKQFRMPDQFKLPGHPDYYTNTDPAGWTIDEAQRYVKDHPAETPQQEIEYKDFLAAKTKQNDEMRAKMSSYGLFSYDRMQQQIAEAKDKGYVHADVLEDPKKLSTLESLMIPYVKGAVGFFTRPFGIEPYGRTDPFNAPISKETLQAAQKEHPAASFIGSGIGGVAPVALAVTTAPEHLLGQLFAFGATGAVSQIGKEKTEGSLMDKKGEQWRIAKATLKSAAYAPLWYYTKALTLGGPVLSMVTRAGARGVGAAGIEKAGGATPQEAVIAGLFTGALSGLSELGPYAIDKINSTVRNRSLDSFADTLVKNDVAMVGSLKQNYVRKYGVEPTDEELTKLVRAGLTIETINNKITTPQILNAENRIKQMYELKIPEVVGAPSGLGQKGSALLPINEGDIVKVGNIVGKVMKIVGDNAVVANALGKEFATSVSRIEPYDEGISAKNIPETPLVEKLRKGLEEDTGVSLEKISPEELDKEPELKVLVERSKAKADQAKVSQKDVNADVSVVAEELKLTSRQHAQEKSAKSIVSKVLRKSQDNPDYTLNDITDYGRGTIVLDNFDEQVEPAIKALVNKGWTPSSNFGKEGFGGFRIFSLNKPSSNGLQVEMQLSNPEIWKKKKEFSDKLYHDNRDLIEKPHSKMTKEEKEKFDAAQELSRKEWEPIYAGLDLDRASMAATSSGDKYTASRMSEELPSESTAGLQRPSEPSTLMGQERKSTTLPLSNLITKSDIVQPPEKSLSQEEGIVKGKENPPEDLFAAIESEYESLSPEDQAKYDLQMDDLNKTPQGNLFVAIRELGKIAPYRTSGAKPGQKFLAEELKAIPASLKDKNAAQTLDTMYKALKTFGWNFDSSDDLLEAIKDQAAHPIAKVSRANLRQVIRNAEKNQKLQQAMIDRFKKERKFGKTVREAGKTSPEVKAGIKKNLYDPITNEETLRQAREFVDQNYNDAVELVEGTSRASTFANAVGIVLIDKAQAEGRFADAIRIVDRMTAKQTELGQAIQVLSTYARLTPEGILQYAKSAVKRAQDAIKQKEKLTAFEKVSNALKTDAEKEAMAKKLGIPYLSEEVAKDLRITAEKIRLGDYDPIIQEALKRNPYRKLAEFLLKDAAPERKAQIAQALLLQKIADLIPATLLPKISILQTMAQLLNPKTIIRNIFGNTGFAVAENIADTFGTALDISTSLITGKRSVAIPSLTTQSKGFIEGLKEGSQEALLGINLKHIGTKFTLPQNGIYDTGVLGALEKTMALVLQAPDRAAYQAAFNASLREQNLFAKTDDPTPEMIEKAHYLGLVRTFQDENVISTQAVKLKQWFNLNKKWGFGDIVLKYPFTPANIIARGIEYTPAGFFKTVFQLGKPLFGREFNQEDFVRSTSRAFTGSALLMGTGAILAGLGIIVGKRSKDKDVVATRQGVGLRDYQINTSALKRFIASGFDPDQAKIREDDTLVNYDWFLPASIPLAMGANMILNPKESLADKAINFGDRVLQASETLMEQPMISGLKRLTGRQSILEGVGETFKGIPSSFVPTILNQVRQLTDNVSRNTRDPNYFQETYKNVATKIPGLSKTLPPQVTPLGEPKEMYQLGSNNPFNVLLNPAFVSKYKPDPVSKMVLDIWENTGETIHFPRVAQTKIKLGSDTPEPIELNPAQYTEFQTYIGRKTDVLFSILQDNEGFMSLPDETKAKKLQGYLTDINTAAKIEVLGYRPQRVPQDVITIIKQIGVDKREIDRNTKEEDLGRPESLGYPDESLGFPEKTK